VRSVESEKTILVIALVVGKGLKVGQSFQKMAVGSVEGQVVFLVETLEIVDVDVVGFGIVVGELYSQDSLGCIGC
jgi:hypothetical protein